MIMLLKRLLYFIKKIIYIPIIFWEKLILKRKRNRLINTTFSLVCNDCCGASILHGLSLRFNSPFVNLWIAPSDFIKMLKKLEFYLSQELIFIKESNINYPVGLLYDVKIYFQHYKSEKEALNKWVTRLQRFAYKNIYILFSDRNGCSMQNLIDFDSLPFENKIVFTHLKLNNIKSSFYIKGFETKECVGNCIEYKTIVPPVRYYDDFIM